MGFLRFWNFLGFGFFALDLKKWIAMYLTQHPDCLIKVGRISSVPNSSWNLSKQGWSSSEKTAPFFHKSSSGEPPLHLTKYLCPAHCHVEDWQSSQVEEYRVEQCLLTATKIVPFLVRVTMPWNQAVPTWMQPPWILKSNTIWKNYSKHQQIVLVPTIKHIPLACLSCELWACLWYF